MSAMACVLRAPALHVVVLGGLLFAVTRPSAPVGRRDGDAVRSIVMTAADVARVRGAWAAQHGTPPDPAQERRLVDAAIDEEVLYREAIRLGLDRDDPTVRARLAQLGRYVAEGPIEDEAALADDARALGLDRTDVVLRRHLVQSVRLLAAGPQAAELPSEAELASYLASHGEAFAQPPRTRFVHVFLSADRRGTAIADDARAIAGQLRARAVPLDEAVALGDAFPRGSVVPPATAGEIDRRFGAGFAAALASAPLEAWTGPVASAYGLHLVWIQERVPARAPRLEEVRGQVLHRVLRERRAARERAAVAALRRRYAVRVEGG